MLLTDVFVCTGVEPPITLLNQYACPNYSFLPFLLRDCSIFMGPPKKKKSEVSTIFSNLTLLTPWVIFHASKDFYLYYPTTPKIKI